MIRVCLSFAVVLLLTSSAFAQAVNPARQYEQQRNSQSPADGVWHVYDRYGNLQKEEHYRAYRLDGIVKTFLPTGSLKAITPYVDGNRVGIEKTFYPSGALQFENNYVDNDLNGISQEYYPTGELKRTANYKGGQLDGVTKVYYPNGSLKQILSYENGVSHGTQLTYGEDGQIKSEDNYQGGMLSTHKDYSNDVEALSAGPKPVAVDPNAAAVKAPLSPPPGKDNAAFSGPASSVPATDAGTDKKSM